MRVALIVVSVALAISLGVNLLMFGSKSSPQPPARSAPFLMAFKDAKGAITVQLDPDGVAEPTGVGILLVDLARHYARMFVQTGRAQSESMALAQIRQLFDAEWNSPTDLGQGGIRN